MIELAMIILVVVTYLYKKQTNNSVEIKSLVKAGNYPKGMLDR